MDTNTNNTLMHLVSAFRTCISNMVEIYSIPDPEVPEYIYEILSGAGCTNEEICMLGFEECIPEEEK